VATITVVVACTMTACRPDTCFCCTAAVRGYRAGGDYKRCLQAAFELHVETLNAWVSQSINIACGTLLVLLHLCSGDCRVETLSLTSDNQYTLSAAIFAVLLIYCPVHWILAMFLNSLGPCRGACTCCCVAHRHCPKSNLLLCDADYDR
jgi:hypothetical protein